MPVTADSVQLTPSWSGTALLMDAPGANLKYRDVEADGLANINCRKGSLRFWFKPSWPTWIGPGEPARLIEMGNTANASDGWWAISINSDGSRLIFESEINGPTHHRDSRDPPATSAATSKGQTDPGLGSVRSRAGWRCRAQAAET